MEGVGLKLDKIFVARLARDPRSIAIVRSTAALAHSLDAELVAEGVEDEQTLRALRQYGRTITQGNVHSPPLSADQLQEWLSAWKPGVVETKPRKSGTTPCVAPARLPIRP